MKLIHCADLHLDSKLTANLTREQVKGRRGEILHTFTRMVDYAASNGVKAILISGDLFDTRNVSVTARNTVLDAILLHPQIDFFYLKGNHDSDNFLSNLSDLPKNLILFHDRWSGKNYGKVHILGVELSKENQTHIYNSLVLDYDATNIVMLHGQESAYRMGDKTEIIDLSQLKNKNIDYLALGHIHAYKRERLDARGLYCYAGCLEGRGFDECGDKGFVLLEIDDVSGKITDTFIPFAYRSLYTISVDCSGCLTTGTALEKAEAVLSEANISPQSMVKIILTGQVDVESEIDTDYITRRVEGNYYFVKTYNETRLHISYETYEKDASLKGEFIRRVHASNLSEEDKARVIQCGIQALAGEEI